MKDTKGSKGSQQISLLMSLRRLPLLTPRRLKPGLRINEATLWVSEAIRRTNGVSFVL